MAQRSGQRALIRWSASKWSGRVSGLDVIAGVLPVDVGDLLTPADPEARVLNNAEHKVIGLREPHARIQGKPPNGPPNAATNENRSQGSRHGVTERRRNLGLRRGKHDRVDFRSVLGEHPSTGHHEIEIMLGGDPQSAVRAYPAYRDRRPPCTR